MMSLGQAIEYAEEVARANESLVSNYERDKKIAEIHRQLAAYLRELQERREAPEIVRCGECKHKSFCPSKIDCGNGLFYYIDFCSNGKMAKKN